MRFVYDGEPPMPQALPPIRGTTITPVDERWLVNPQNKGVANVIVFLVKRNGAAAETHPDLVKPQKSSVELAIDGGRLVPRVTIVRLDQQLVIKNRHPVGHALKSDFFYNTNWSDLHPAGGTIKKTFKERELLPSSLQCTITFSLQGYLFVTDNRYVAVSDSDGNVAIPLLPVGDLTFRVMHDGRFVKSAVHEDMTVKWNSGLMSATIGKAGTDLGTFAIK